VAGLFVVDKYLRFQFLEITNHYIYKYVGVDYVFIGDSLTARGHNFGWRLSGNPFSSRNLGCSGYTVHQVLGLVPQALECHPRWVCIMAGTNDFNGGGYNSEQILLDYKLMLVSLKEGHAKPVVTLMPQFADGRHSGDIDLFNAALRQLCAEQSVPVVDLNSQIAPNGKLLPQFTVDGVHFTPAAYKIWVSQLRRVIID
jgi:alpha-glucosidase